MALDGYAHRRGALHGQHPDRRVPQSPVSRRLSASPRAALAAAAGTTTTPRSPRHRRPAAAGPPSANHATGFSAASGRGQALSMALRSRGRAEHAARFNLTTPAELTVQRLDRAWGRRAPCPRRSSHRCVAVGDKIRPDRAAVKAAGPRGEGRDPVTPSKWPTVGQDLGIDGLRRDLGQGHLVTQCRRGLKRAMVGDSVSPPSTRGCRYRHRCRRMCGICRSSQ